MKSRPQERAIDSQLGQTQPTMRPVLCNILNTIPYSEDTCQQENRFLVQRMTAGCIGRPKPARPVARRWRRMCCFLISLSPASDFCPRCNSLRLLSHLCARISPGQYGVFALTGAASSLSSSERSSSLTSTSTDSSEPAENVEKPGYDDLRELPVQGHTRQYLFPMTLRGRRGWYPQRQHGRELLEFATADLFERNAIRGTACSFWHCLAKAQQLGRRALT